MSRPARSSILPGGVIGAVPVQYFERAPETDAVARAAQHRAFALWHREPLEVRRAPKLFKGPIDGFIRQDLAQRLLGDPEADECA